jgi:hypothetical protein
MFQIFGFFIGICVTGTQQRKMWECSKMALSKAAAVWASGAYGGVREHDHAATCLREAAPAKAGNAAGGLFQHSH